MAKQQEWKKSKVLKALTLSVLLDLLVATSVLHPKHLLSLLAEEKAEESKKNFWCYKLVVSAGEA